MSHGSRYIGSVCGNLYFTSRIQKVPPCQVKYLRPLSRSHNLHPTFHAPAYCLAMSLYLKMLKHKTEGKASIDFDLTLLLLLLLLQLHHLLVGPNWFSTFTPETTQSVFSPNFQLAQQAQFSTCTKQPQLLLQQQVYFCPFPTFKICSSILASSSVCILRFSCLFTMTCL